MTKKEMIIDILKTTGCLTAKQIQSFILRKYNENITPASVSGNLRPFIERGYVGHSKNMSNHTVYWLNKETYHEGVKL